MVNFPFLDYVNVVTRKILITYVAHIAFVIDNAVLGYKLLKEILVNGKCRHLYLSTNKLQWNSHCSHLFYREVRTFKLILN